MKSYLWIFWASSFVFGVMVSSEMSSTNSNDFSDDDYSAFYSSKRVEHSIVDKCKAGEPCVRFCCLNETSCSKNNFFDLSSHPGAVNLSTEYNVLRGKPCAAMLVDDSGDPWGFLKNGTVELEVSGTKHLISHKEYCLEKNESHHLLLICDMNDEETVDKKPSDVDSIKKWYPILMLSSVPFLLATLLVYACIGELRTLHGKCLMCYLFGLICIYLSFPLIELNQNYLSETAWLCTGAGYIAYISVLIAFFWLNVMCYDIYSTFRRIQNSFSNSRGCGGGKRGDRRFLHYCIYAFGMPVLIVTAACLLDNFTNLPDDYKTRIGHLSRCYFKKTKLIELIYVYIPISCVLISNTFFYCTTAIKIYRIQRETSIVREGESSRHSRISVERERFFLYLRLFIVMGVLWIIEIISWALHNSIELHVFDILNCLQGFIIFFMFVWKATVKKMILRRLSTTRSSSSQKRRNLSTDSSLALSTQPANVTSLKLKPISRQAPEFPTVSTSDKV